jgi:Flp pilus assembly protein TadG
VNLLTHVRRLRRENSGAALVEFTILAPLLLSLMCGLAEFGQLLRQYHVMEKGVRDAARYLAAVPVNPACTGVTDPAGYTWANAKAEAQNLAVFGSTTGTTPLVRTWTSTATVTVDDGTCLANPRPNGLPLAKITVTASAPYAGIGMLGYLGFGAPTLTVSHQELKVF